MKNEGRGNLNELIAQCDPQPVNIGLQPNTFCKLISMRVLNLPEIPEGCLQFELVIEAVE